MSALRKTCNLCQQTTQADGDDLLYFGEWMTREDITVHYFCLLLSTHLPQQGKEHAGILGFLLSDVLKESELAKSRTCCYCCETSATIMCQSCKVYFHLPCGFTNCAVSQFVGQFRSYCDNCVPRDNHLEAIKKTMDIKYSKCSICLSSIGYYRPAKCIYGKCCGNGFVHSKCMKKYALSAGFFLKCIWCKCKNFREDIKYFGVFVPDREASWNLEQDQIQKPISSNDRDVQKDKKCTAISSKFCDALGGIDTTLYIRKDVNMENNGQENNLLDSSDESFSSVETVIERIK